MATFSTAISDETDTITPKMLCAVDVKPNRGTWRLEFNPQFRSNTIHN